MLKYGTAFGENEWRHHLIRQPFGLPPSPQGEGFRAAEICQMNPNMSNGKPQHRSLGAAAVYFSLRQAAFFCGFAAADRAEKLKGEQD